MWYGIILCIGIVLFVIGAYKFNERLHALKNGHSVPATVVELESYKDSDGDVLYRPVFLYKVGYKEYQYVYRVGSRPAAWRVGETTTLIVENEDPEKVMVLTYFGVFSSTIILIAIALPLLFIGAGYFWANSFLQKWAISAF